mmetsp:Transcript_13903/g.39569  ORF Transcript_13903/g.39569 Transcript_13903/m.39569 type:complete len:307 (-) Transcript_13903:1143-2063(-)
MHKRRDHEFGLEDGEDGRDQTLLGIRQRGGAGFNEERDDCRIDPTEDAYLGIQTGLVAVFRLVAFQLVDRLEDVRYDDVQQCDDDGSRIYGMVECLLHQRKACCDEHERQEKGDKTFLALDEECFIEILPSHGRWFHAFHNVQHERILKHVLWRQHGCIIRRNVDLSYSQCLQGGALCTLCVERDKDGRNVVRLLDQSLALFCDLDDFLVELRIRSCYGRVGTGKCKMLVMLLLMMMMMATVAETSLYVFLVAIDRFQDIFVCAAAVHVGVSGPLQQATSLRQCLAQFGIVQCDRDVDDVTKLLKE